MSKDDAIREAHRNYDEEEYFHARPQIDCNDRRRVFKAGFDRGWKSAREDVERFLKDEETIEECLMRNRRDIDTLMGKLAELKTENERLGLVMTEIMDSLGNMVNRFRVEQS